MRIITLLSNIFFIYRIIERKGLKIQPQLAHITAALADRKGARATSCHGTAREVGAVL